MREATWESLAPPPLISMRRIITFLVFLSTVVAMPLPVRADPVGEGGGGIVLALNGDGLAIRVPRGWILDNHAMARQGIDMLFYPTDTGFHGFGPKTPAYAFVMPTIKGGPEVSVQWLIDMRDEQIRESDKDATTVIERPPAPSKYKGETVTVVRYSLPSIPLFERVAYLEDNRTIYAVVLGASSAKGLEKRSHFIDYVINNHRRLISGD